MKLALVNSARSIAVAASAIALAASVAVLGFDHLVKVRNADQLAERLRMAEETAREDPAAAEALQAEVDQQTNSSLARDRRQRYAAVIALVAAGTCLTLIKVRKAKAPPLPRLVSDALKRHVPDGRSECSAEPAVNGASTPSAIDVAPVDAIVERIGRQQRQLIPLLHAVDEHYHYLPPQAIGRLAESTEIAHDEIAGVASFYKQFRTRPRGKHLLRVCRGTACHVAGADRLTAELHRLLNIPASGDTDSDGIATVEEVGCLGCCTLAPTVDVDQRIEGHVVIDRLAELVDWTNPQRLHASVEDPASRAASNGHARRATAAPPLEIRIGLGSCCVAGGSRDVMECLEKEIALRRVDAVIKPVGCVGICHLTPLVEVEAPGAEPIVATRATPADVQRIVRSLPGQAPWSRRWRNRLADVWRRDEPASNGTGHACQIYPVGDVRVRRFVDPQIRIVTEHSGQMDPASLEQYRDRDGFAALERCLSEMQPTSVIDEIEQSGLRGRGGGGYPTASKWRKVSAATGEKFLVCNGDEGDPGAFMDRMIMESFAFRVLEGMAIAAYAVGARQAFVYVRREYPLAVKRIRHAIERMTEEGWLGDAVAGTPFGLHIEVVEGAGAFVCGEETALLESIMGRRGIPQIRPPYPVERGLFDRPTLVNNVETFANVPWILRHGAERFAGLGTQGSTGTKVFSLAGKIRRGGLIEIPMGLSLREVIEDIGGGVAEGRKFKAVQIGGPSGGCVPAELADTPIDFENLKKVGAIMGSGGLVVLDDTDCMVDVARYFLEFTQQESCGHCTFCRVGTRKLLDILERICAGKGRPRDLDEIDSLSQSVKLGSLCGLGKTAPNPVLSTLRYFRDEYEAHLKGHCPAGRCKGLIRYDVTRDCVGCTLCAQCCPVSAIPAAPYRQHVIDSDVCTRCDACRVACPEDAIVVV